MQVKISLKIILLILTASLASFAQKNPYKEIGKKTKVLTLTDGKYDEFFDDEDVQQIGTALVNIQTSKVVKLLTEEEAERRLDNTTGKRFLSVDPLSKKYPMLTPYQFASNTPIQAVDLDGLESWVVVKTTIKDKTYIHLKFDKDLINEGGVYYVHRWMDTKSPGFVASEASGSVGYSEYPEYFPNFTKGIFDAANFTNYNTMSFP
ncbi:MAG: hypothetical protein IT249_19190 [Chitinophagaceae bacterium]|nr:hypothetical protein [Chitinophagaceae bacterium]